MEEHQTSNSAEQQELTAPPTETIYQTNNHFNYFMIAVVGVGILVATLVINSFVFKPFFNYYFPEPADADLTEWQYQEVTLAEFDATVNTFPYQASPERVQHIDLLRLHADPGMKIDPDTYTTYLEDGRPLPIIKGISGELIVPDVVQRLCPRKESDSCVWKLMYFVYRGEAGIVNEKHDVWLSISTNDHDVIQDIVWHE